MYVNVGSRHTHSISPVVSDKLPLRTRRIGGFTLVLGEAEEEYSRGLVPWRYKKQDWWEEQLGYAIFILSKTQTPNPENCLERRQGKESWLVTHQCKIPRNFKTVKKIFQYEKQKPKQTSRKRKRERDQCRKLKYVGKKIKILKNISLKKKNRILIQKGDYLENNKSFVVLKQEKSIKAKKQTRKMVWKVTLRKFSGSKQNRKTGEKSWEKWKKKISQGSPPAKRSYSKGKWREKFQKNKKLKFLTINSRLKGPIRDRGKKKKKKNLYQNWSSLKFENI